MNKDSRIYWFGSPKKYKNEDLSLLLRFNCGKKGVEKLTNVIYGWILTRMRKMILFTEGEVLLCSAQIGCFSKLIRIWKSSCSVGENWFPVRTISKANLPWHIRKIIGHATCGQLFVRCVVLSLLNSQCFIWQKFGSRSEYWDFLRLIEYF